MSNSQGPFPPPHDEAGRPGGESLGSFIGAAVSLSSAALENFPSPVLLVNRDGVILVANPAAQTLHTAFDSPAGEEARQQTALTIAQGGGAFNAAFSEIASPMSKGLEFHLVIAPLEGGDQALVFARDLSLERSLRSALVDSRQRYKDLVDISADFAWESDVNGRLIFVSPRGALGYSADDLVGKDPNAFLMQAPLSESGSPFSATEPMEGVELWMRRMDGKTACLSASGSPLYEADGTWRGARGVCRDITILRERDAALAQARNRERTLTHIVRTFRDEVDPQNMLQVAAEGVAMGLSAETCQIFHAVQPEGEPPSLESMELAASSGPDVDGEQALRALSGLVGGPDFLEMSISGHMVLGALTRYNRRVNGALLIWRDANRGPWSDNERILIGDLANQVGVANEQIFNHLKIVEISRTDPLTGLLNRRAFTEEAERRLERLTYDHLPCALLYVDLDNFKAVNDLHGHQQGDEALLAVVKLLHDCVRPTDLVARLGGDEFAIWLDGAGDVAAAGRAQAILDHAHQLVSYSGAPDKPLGLSVGVAVYDPAVEEHLDLLMKRADEAMYEVKKQGKGAFALSTATGGVNVAEAKPRE